MSESERFFHVGYAVPDLEAAMAELTATLGLRWQVPLSRAVGGLRWRVTFSLEGPTYVEMIEGGPGTPWEVGSAPLLHHVGRFTTDLGAELAKVVAAGGEVETDGRRFSGQWAYVRMPRSGARLELIEAADGGRLRLQRLGEGRDQMVPEPE